MKEQIFNYLGNNTGALTIEDIFMNFFVAALLGFIIYISYFVTHTGTIYSSKFNVSLVMLTLVTTLVMNVIGNNIALSLGMVGALSIVRFRTAVKDTRDTVYIFWSITVGICCGVSEFITAAIGSCVIFLFLVLFGMVKSNERYLLIVKAKRENLPEINSSVDTIFAGREKRKVENTTEEFVELIFEISENNIRKITKKGIQITEELYKIKGIQYVNLVCQSDEINR